MREEEGKSSVIDGKKWPQYGVASLLKKWSLFLRSFNLGGLVTGHDKLSVMEAKMYIC